MDSNKLPCGFSTKFHPYCDSCPNFEVEVTGGALTSFDGETWGTWDISCRHYNTCASIKRHIQKENSNGSKDV